MDKVTQALLLLLFACSAASIVAELVHERPAGAMLAQAILVEGYFREPQRHHWTPVCSQKRADDQRHGRLGVDSGP
jgi:hypothetical protein